MLSVRLLQYDIRDYRTEKVEENETEDRGKKQKIDKHIKTKPVQ